MERITVGHKHFAHEHRVSARTGIVEHVVCRGNSRFGHPYHGVRHHADHFVEDCHIHLKGLEVARVNSENLRTGVETPQSFVAVVRLNEGCHTQRMNTLDERRENRLLKSCDDDEDEIGAMRTSFPDLIRGNNEIFAQDRNVYTRTYSIKISQRAAKAPLFCEHRDRGGATLFVQACEVSRVRDVGKRALRRALPLHLSNNLNRTVVTAGLEYVESIERTTNFRCPYLEVIEAHGRFTFGQILTDSRNDVV